MGKSPSANGLTIDSDAAQAEKRIAVLAELDFDSADADG